MQAGSSAEPGRLRGLGKCVALGLVALMASLGAATGWSAPRKLNIVCKSGDKSACRRVTARLTAELSELQAQMGLEELSWRWVILDDRHWREVLRTLPARAPSRESFTEEGFTLWATRTTFLRQDAFDGKQPIVLRRLLVHELLHIRSFDEDYVKRETERLLKVFRADAKTAPGTHSHAQPRPTP